MTEEDIRREYPTVKALEKLGEWWPSPDGMNFAVYEGNEEFLLGHVQCCITTNSYLGRELSEKYTLHIQQIIVCDDLRGCGILAVICKRLIDVAEEAGVFVGGTARNFNGCLPQIRTREGYLRFLEMGFGGYKRRREESRASKSLLQKYVEYGFCRYDGTGYPMNDRRWKKLCFGYTSSRLEDKKVAQFLQSHLLC